METTDAVALVPPSPGTERRAVPVTLMRPSASRVRVALVRPPVVVVEKRVSWMALSPHIGLAYVAAAIREDGHDLQVVDAVGEAIEQVEEFTAAGSKVWRHGLSPEQIVERIRPGTRVIGITNTFLPEWPTIRELVGLARQAFPDAVIVMGGENASGFWPWILEQAPGVDCVVRGEGEQTARELIARIGAGQRYDDLPGLVVRRAAEPAIDTGLPVRLRDLEQHPQPAWDLFPMDGYFRYRSFLGVDRGRSLPVVATRGCPYRCTFCSAPQMWTTRYVVRDPSDVVDEIESNVERFGIRNVDFVDLTAVTRRSWTLELCDELERRGVEVSLQMPTGTRSEALDEEVMRRLRSAGVRNMMLAPETGSPRMLEVYGKKVKLEHLLEAVRGGRRAGVVTAMNFIIGHPAETWSDRWQTWKYMLRGVRAGVSQVAVSSFFPYPGSADFTSLVESGDLVVDDDYYYDAFTHHVRTRRGSAGRHSRDLYWMQMFMILSCTALIHLLHPTQLLHLVRTVLFGGTEETVLEQMIRTKLSGPLSWRRKGTSPAVMRPRVTGSDAGTGRSTVEDHLEQHEVLTEVPSVDHVAAGG